MIGKELKTALVRAFAVRGAAMEELFEGERADLVEQLRDTRAKLADDEVLARLIDLSLEMGALPAMRGAMQVWESLPA
jgi:hypothetical protein